MGNTQKHEAFILKFPRENTSIEAAITDETAIGFIPCYQR